MAGLGKDERIVRGVERAIDRLVDVFQSDLNKSWNERDMHWILFHYIKQEDVVQEDYSTQLVRAEFPTLKRSEGERDSDRFHFELVILDRESWLAEDVQTMRAWDPWEEFLKRVKVAVAVEMKLWTDRANPKRVEELVSWDVDKLVAPENGVRNAYFVNLVQLDFARAIMSKYYPTLRDRLKAKAQPNLKIVCAPSDIRVQPNSKDNWLSCG